MRLSLKGNEPALAIVSSGRELEGLATGWWELWEAVEGATPFTSPAWLLPWWHSFGGSDVARLRALVVREGERLVGLWPLYLLDDAGTRKLLPVGIGVSDHLDPLIAPGMTDAVAARFRAGVLEVGAEADRIHLEPLRPEAPWLHGGAWAEAGFGVHPSEPAPALQLPTAAETATEPLRGRLKKLPYYRRRAERLGAYSVAHLLDERALPAFRRLVELHAGRWRSKGEHGVLADPIVQAFHRAALPSLLHRGLARFTVLTIAGAAVAIVYALRHRGTMYLYIGGWDPAIDHPGLGALAVGETVEAAIQEGCDCLDFLRGTEPYKYSWGAADRSLVALRAIVAAPKPVSRDG